ncbi:MAG: DUF3800 domain-containing protein [Elusimicrobiota bacterium]
MKYYFFLDESGDLGFDFTKRRTSKYFVITFLFVKEKGPVEKIIKKIFSGFTKKEIKRHNGVLHCYKEHPTVRKKVLGLLSQKDVSIISIYLNKRKVYTKLQDEKHVLYNYVANILLDRIYSRKLVPFDRDIILVASRRETNRFLNENFRDYLTNKVRINHDKKLIVEIKFPSQEKCLQVVDFVCWSIFRSKEYEDNSYYDIIRIKIVEENPLFP